MSESVRVLHVGSEAIFVDWVATILEREDNSVRVATESNANDALSRIAEGDFDCIVSEYDMPGMNGIEFLRVVRDDFADLSFVLFAGTGLQDIGAAISAGVSDYLQQESDTDQSAILANRITALVSKYQAEARVEYHPERQRKTARNRKELREITADPGTTPEERIRHLLRWVVTSWKQTTATWSGSMRTAGAEVISVYGAGIVQEGTTDLSETYCRKTIESEGIRALYNAPKEGGKPISHTNNSDWVAISTRNSSSKMNSMARCAS